VGERGVEECAAGCLKIEDAETAKA
jgi:hypothetical protein